MPVFITQSTFFIVQDYIKKAELNIVMALICSQKPAAKD
jgi:glutathione synthase/RimK-type ligase-like ATP-grasp enzyme